MVNMQDTKDYILENMIKDFKEAEIRGFYIISTDEEYDHNSGYNRIRIIGFGYDGNEETKYYDFGDCRDVINLMNFGMAGLSMDIEHDNGLVRVFWNDRKPRKINSIDAFLSIFTVYGEEII